jgi:hypothetical protein
MLLYGMWLIRPKSGVKSVVSMKNPHQTTWAEGSVSEIPARRLLETPSSMHLNLLQLFYSFKIKQTLDYPDADASCNHSLVLCKRIPGCQCLHSQKSIGHDHVNKYF